MEIMKAIVCEKYGPPEVLHLTHCNKPSPKEDEVLIKIFAASVTNSDIFIRSAKVSLLLMIPFRLKMGLRKPRNPVIGKVFAGIIEYAGPGIKRFKSGDHVYGLTGFSLGAYADYKCMNEIDSIQGCLAIMPANLSFEDATSAAYGALLLQSDRLDSITKLVESGAIKPVTDRIYPFDQIVQAHTYVECGHKRGNVAITFN